jgi:DNA-directed RNA polymerase specialized sigma24 family protein
MQRERATHRQSFLTRLGLTRLGRRRSSRSDAPAPDSPAAAHGSEPLERLLSPLTSFERDVLVRRITKGHSAKRVARDLGISLAEVRTIQRCALRRILPPAR